MSLTNWSFSGGYCNSITVVSRQRSSVQEPKEPLSVLIRRKGGNVVDVDEFAINTDTSSALIAYEMSRRGLGPKMYGVFKGGSVEEYIDSHTLTSEESCILEISHDVAISIANVHAIKGLPLKKTIHQDNMRKQMEWIKNIPNSREYLSNNKSLAKYNFDIDFLFSFDYEKETEYLMSKFNQIKSRKNFILNDMNYLNCLVRNNPTNGQLRVMLIDYDLGHYDYRGIDLGMHFFNRRFNVQGKEEKIIPGSKFPTTEEKKRFLKIYQQEIKRLNIWDDFEENGIDSVDNLLIESMVGHLQFTLYFGCYMMAKPEVFLEFDPSFGPVVEFMLKQFLCMKNDIETILH